MDRVALILAVVASTVFATNVRADDELAVPISQVSQCLKVATNNQPGNIRAVEIKKDNDRNICEVEIKAKKQEYKVKVDLKNYRILKVEKED